MGRLRNLQTNFTSGELDPKLRGRRKIAHWFNGARFLRNVIERPQGGVHRRPGGRYRDELPRTLNKITNNTVDGDLIDSTEGSISSSDWNSLEANIIDVDISTFAFSDSVTTQSFVIDWGASNDKDVSGIIVREAASTHFLGGGSDRAVTVDVEGSATGAFGGEEVSIGSQAVTMKAGVVTAGSPRQNYNVGMDTVGVSYRYHRVTFTYTTATNGYLAEVEFYENGTPNPATVTAPNGGTAGNLLDDDSTTEVVTTANISTTDPYVIAHVDFGEAKSIIFVDTEGLRLSAAPAGGDALIESVRVQYSTDDISFTDFGQPFGAVNTTDLTRRRSNDGAAAVSARYWRLVKTGVEDGGTAKFHVDGMCFFEELTALSAVRLIPFIRSLSLHYMVAHTDRNCRVYKNGAWVADVQSPVTSAQLSEMDFVQALDTLLLFHHDQHPTRIFRENQDDDWSSADAPFTNIPQHDFGDGAEDSWSETRGYPRCGTFFQSRLWMAGSKERPDTVFASQSDDVFNFDIGTGLDDEAIDKTILSDTLVSFHQLYPGRHLYAFGDKAEFYSENSENEILTPSNFALRATTRAGSKIGVKVYEVDGAVLFVQRGGAVVREFIFTDNEAAYLASNISLLSSHLIRTPVDTSLRQAIEDDDADIYFVVNSDGTMATFTTLRTQDISAWMMQHTEGSYLACAVDLDEVFHVVQRTIGGTAKNFIEEWDDDLMVDAAVSGTVSVATTSISGLDHLEGETVEAVLDSINHGTFTVSSGAITVPSFSSTYQVGLAFPDVTDDQDIVADDTVELTDKQVLIVELPVEGDLPDGTVANKKKRVTDVGLILHQTRHLELNGDDLVFRKLGAGILNDPIPLFTGTYREAGLLGWTLEGAVQLSQDRAGEFELLGIVKEVSV